MGGKLTIYYANRCVYYEYRGNIASRFSSNSEVDASDLLENTKGMFPNK